MAAGHKTGGRQKGTRNKRTVEREQLLEEARQAVGLQLGHTAFDGDAHAFLVSIYGNTELPTDMRLEAARAAIPYEKPRLNSLDVGGKADRPIQVVVRRFSDAPIA